MNKDIEIHDFDADPGWLGPKKLNYLASISLIRCKNEVN